ncbi:MAG: hypothetical protein EBV32_04340 [Proteobacteria bacterium]|uniref:Acid phosphatase n=1 Tax=Candidatus Fonsibacter lacus TaxID=2576439 RepID=A0A964V0E8_9PROT|nr:hypothetical protein [Candidatus Fonsibacter lacus]NCU72384.1 hypothetical protein [Candidatus Fonsibacter lacus]
MMLTFTPQEDWDISLKRLSLRAKSTKEWKMPTPKANETEEEFITRCMSDAEPKSKYPDEDQRYAVCKSIYDGPVGAYRRAFSPQRISFDYDETLSTEDGMTLAKDWIKKGAEVYIISARSSVQPMLARAEELGIPKSRVFATGSNKAKVDKIHELNINRHYDNNADVVKALHGIGVQLADSYTDYPKAAIENAKTALRWAEQNGWGACGTPVGKKRANDLAAGRPLSEETIARMAGFERHRQNSQRELGDGCGRLMWLAWGGDEGIDWAKRKLKEIDSGKA